MTYKVSSGTLSLYTNTRTVVQKFSRTQCSVIGSLTCLEPVAKRDTVSPVNEMMKDTAS